MKSKLFLVALLSIGISSMAQNIKFGVKAGLNLSFLSLAGSIPGGGSTSSNTGFLIGGLAEYQVNDKFSIQPELLFSTDGGIYQYSNAFVNSATVYNYKQTITTSTISLPVVAKYYVSEGLSIDGGLQIAYLINAKSKLDYSTLVSNYSVTGDNDMSNSQSNLTAGSTPSSNFIVSHDYELNKLNFGLVLGTTYNLKKGFFFQVRYNLGLTSFTKNANVLAGKEVTSGSVGDERYKGATLSNSNLQFSVGYKFQ